MYHTWLHQTSALQSGRTQKLAKDIQWAQDAVNNLVERELEQHQFDALVIFVYNVGEAAFSSSTILRKLNDQYSLDTEDEFQRWIWAGGKISIGLINRRIKERDLFLGRNSLTT